MFCCSLALVCALAVWLSRPQEDLSVTSGCSTAGTTAAAAFCLNKPEARCSFLTIKAKAMLLTEERTDSKVLLVMRVVVSRLDDSRANYIRK